MFSCRRYVSRDLVGVYRDRAFDRTVKNRHPNFKGGTIRTPHGYVMRYVGKAHHLANVNGYAYEHRLIAEKKLGRKLRKGECAHHKNGNSGDNAPSNIIPKRNHFAHKAEHRKTDRGLRNPGERNPLVKCECGCGVKFRKFDRENRPRRYAVGCSWRKGTGKKNSKEKIVCECGCGMRFNRFDPYGRERRFVSGHNGVV